MQNFLILLRENASCKYVYFFLGGITTANDLSAREVEVCTLIMLGHSSESISLKLDLSLNTIFTYRKRAYAKLNINSQNELFRICLD